MRVYVQFNGRSLAARVPFAGADHVILALDSCPRCKARLADGLTVRGSGNRRESHDTYAAEAFTGCCGERIGTIRAVVSTIFGLEEDERVLNGRCRVY